MVTTTVGDSIRSKIGKAKKKTPVKRPTEKKTVGQPINRSTDES
jgi:hypothetical protein